MTIRLGDYMVAYYELSLLFPALTHSKTRSEHAQTSEQQASRLATCCNGSHCTRKHFAASVVQLRKMRGISADILGQIILQSYKYFPELYTSNYTLGQVLTAVRFNSTSLALIVNSTGLDEQVVTQTVDFYLTIMPYFQSTVSTPAQNQILNIR